MYSVIEDLHIFSVTAPTIERTTYQSYESMIRARLEPFFRERKL